MNLVSHQGYKSPYPISHGTSGVMSKIVSTRNGYLKQAPNSLKIHANLVLNGKITCNISDKSIK